MEAATALGDQEGIHNFLGGMEVAGYSSTSWPRLAEEQGGTIGHESLQYMVAQHLLLIPVIPGTPVNTVADR